jgi:HEAT repeat protein
MSGDKRVLEAVAKTLSDSDALVRTAAVDTLSELVEADERNLSVFFLLERPHIRTYTNIRAESVSLLERAL